MTSLFLDCNDQLAPVWARVIRPDDPPIDVNRAAFTREDLPRVIRSYDIVIDDHSYMPTPLVAQCPELKHIVFLGTGPASYMNVDELAYRGVTVYETPPPTQGLSVLQMLNLLEPYGLSRLEYLGPDAVHLLVQAKQIAFHDRDRLIADPDFVKVPAARLVSKAYADERRPLMDPARALPWDRVPSSGSLAGDTVSVCAVDARGNAASLIQSLYGVYGSGMVAGRTGVVLQNRSAYFSLDPAHPNRLEPGKIPLHTLIASPAFKDDALWQVFGCVGAYGQPQIHLQAYPAMIHFGLAIQQAVETALRSR